MLRILSGNVFFTVGLILLMCMISFALVGRSLMFDEQTTISTSLIRASSQSNAYFSSQRAVIAFNFFYMVSSWSLLYTTFGKMVTQNLIANFIYFLAWIGRWASSIGFLASYETLKKQL